MQRFNIVLKYAFIYFYTLKYFFYLLVGQKVPNIQAKAGIKQELSKGFLCLQLTEVCTCPWHDLTNVVFFQWWMKRFS